MDRLSCCYVPGTLLGRLRHRAEGGVRRWRKLPPTANSDAEPDPDTDADAGTDPVGDSVAECGAVTKRNAVAEGHAFGVNTHANPDGNPVAQPDSVGNAQCDTDTEDNAGRLPDPHAGSGGRVGPIPAAAQAARWGTAGPHGHRRRPAD